MKKCITLLLGLLVINSMSFAAEKVTIPATEAISLAGELFGKGNTGVILCHMYPTTKESWIPMAQQFADAGFVALVFDFRGYGESTGEKDIAQIHLDVEAALRYMKETLKVSQVFLIGASMGGAASLMAASKQPVTGVVCVSGPTEFKGLEALSLVDKITAPKLFIASTGDGSAAKSAQRFYDKATEPKQIVIFDGTEHGTFIFQGTHGEQLQKALLEFVRKYSTK